MFFAMFSEKNLTKNSNGCTVDFVERIPQQASEYFAANPQRLRMSRRDTSCDLLGELPT
jgi:hypothetical protein